MKRLSLLLVALVVMAGCGKDPLDLEQSLNTDIPPDPEGSAPETRINNLAPSVTFKHASPDNVSRIQMSVLGLMDPASRAPIDLIANHNVFVTEDGVLQGIKCSPIIDVDPIAVDLVFVFDNSGSMGEEADRVANEAADYASLLSRGGINLQVGSVGYKDNGDISGALNLTSSEQFVAYVNRASVQGIDRTRDFSGPDATLLEQEAGLLDSAVADENGIVGIWFANDRFSWRPAALRVYVNFTDEPTQPSGRPRWSTENLCAEWTPEMGTIHTVWSNGDPTGRRWTPLQKEDPCELSVCTGGSHSWVDASARNLDLTTLPVTNLLLASFLVEFVTDAPSAAHDIEIAVIGSESADGATRLEGVQYSN